MHQNITIVTNLSRIPTILPYRPSVWGLGDLHELAVESVWLLGSCPSAGAFPPEFCRCLPQESPCSHCFLHGGCHWGIPALLLTHQALCSAASEFTSCSRWKWPGFRRVCILSNQPCKDNLFEPGLCDDRLIYTYSSPTMLSAPSLFPITLRIHGNRCMPKVCSRSWWKAVAIRRAC